MYSIACWFHSKLLYNTFHTSAAHEQDWTCFQSRTFFRIKMHFSTWCIFTKHGPIKKHRNLIAFCHFLDRLRNIAYSRLKTKFSLLFFSFRALYNYKPQNDDEVELAEGDVVYVMEKCDDGWYVGTSQRTGIFGTFPGNYVAKA